MLALKVHVFLPICGLRFLHCEFPLVYLQHQLGPFCVLLDGIRSENGQCVSAIVMTTFWWFRLVVKHHSLDTIVPAALTSDIFASIDWCVVFCAKIADVLIDTQVPGSPVQELDDDDDVNIHHSIDL